MSEIKKPEKDNDVSAEVTSPEQLRQQEKHAQEAGAEINNLSLDNSFETHESKDTRNKKDSSENPPLDENDLEFDKIDSNGEARDKVQEQVAEKENKINLYEKHKEIVKEAFDNASGLREINEDGDLFVELSSKEKDVLSTKLKDNINSVPKGERENYRVPEPEKIKSVTQLEDGSVKIDEAWKPNHDGAKEGTRHMEVVRAKDENGNPNYIDRIGSDSGSYFSPMKEDGTPYSLRERAIGDYLPEDRLEDNDSYHKYEIKQDFTRENFEAAIDRTYTDPRENAFMKATLEMYYQDSVKVEETKGHDGEAYSGCSENDVDGVKTGEIDNMFGTKENPDGGAIQYLTPFSASELEAMGMIEEVNKGVVE